MPEPTIKAKLVLESDGGLTGVAAAGRTAGGLVGATVGKIAKGVFAGQAALEAMKKLMGKLVEASPRLQMSLNILNKSLQLLLRPIGDVLSLFLKPFAIGMLKWGIKFYRKWVESDFFKTAMEEGVGAAIKEKTIFAERPGSGGLFSPTGFARTEEGKPAPTFLGLFPLAEDKLIEIGDKLKRVFSVWNEKLSDVGDLIGKKTTEVLDSLGIPFDKIINFFNETLPKKFDKVAEKIGIFWSKTLPNIFKSLWEKITEFWKVKLPKWIDKGFSHLRKTITELIPSWISSMASKIKGKISKHCFKS
jgi:hypothetical protein